MSFLAEHRSGVAAEAKAEALRFLKRVEAWEKATASDPGFYPSREWGAVYRASMDLNNALVTLRANPYELARKVKGGR